MSEALRDERVKLYSFSDVATDGRVAPTYTYARTCWGRQAIPGSREATIAGQASQRVDAVFVIPEGIVVDQNGGIRGQDGTFYVVTGVLPVRNTASLREQIVFAENAEEQNPNVVES